MFCNCSLCVLCIYCFSPLFYCPVVSTTAAGAPMIDYVVDDRTPSTVELPGKQSHFPSPTYHLLFYIYLLHKAYAAATLQSYFNCIAYPCRPLITFRYPMLPIH